MNLGVSRDFKDMDRNRKVNNIVKIGAESIMDRFYLLIGDTNSKTSYQKTSYRHQWYSSIYDAVVQFRRRRGVDISKALMKITAKNGWIL